ncbi:MAG: CHAD domain-containing protein [Phycisphaerales bacterium]
MVLPVPQSPSDHTAPHAGGSARPSTSSALNGSNGTDHSAPHPRPPRAPSDRVSLRPTLNVTDAAALVISERFEAVARALEDLHESPQGVRETHALRVSTRRATAALTVFAPQLDPKLARKAKQRLRALRAAAGAVRSCDVQEELLLAAERDPLHDEALVVAAELMLGRVQRWREKARHGLVEARENHRPRRARRTGERLIGTLHNALGRVHPASAASTEGPARTVPAFRHAAAAHTALEAARAGVSAARRRFEEARRHAEPMADFEALHEMRLAGKRLRYVIELMAPALDEEPAESAVATLRKLQDRLGEVNDRHELARRTDAAATELGLRPNGKTARAFATLRQTLVASRDTLLDDFEQWWSADENGTGGKSIKLDRALDRLLGIAESPRSQRATSVAPPNQPPSDALRQELGEAIENAAALVRHSPQEASA